MSLLLVKLILSPLLIWAITLVTRRWGPVIGGWIAGLPSISGPVSVFLALEQGREFAAAAAISSILGITATSAFCIAYAKSARRFPWPVALSLGFFAYLVLLCILSLTPSILPIAAALAFVILSAALLAIGYPDANPEPILSPPWDLPLRMGIAAGMLLLITGIASYIGPKWSGLLSPFPVFLSVLSVFTHFQSGSAAVHQFMRGILTGIFGFAAFFVMVALSIRTVNLPIVYVLATIVAIMINLAMLRLAQKRRE